MNISDVSVSKINGSLVSKTFKCYLIKKTQTTQLLIIWTSNLEYIEPEHFYYHFINIPIFSPQILTCKERPVHENGSLKELKGVIMWARGSLTLECNFQWRRWKMLEQRRWHVVLLRFPEGAAGRTWRSGEGGHGRVMRLGDIQAWFYLIILSVHQIQNWYVWR